MKKLADEKNVVVQKVLRFRRKKLGYLSMFTGRGKEAGKKKKKEMKEGGVMEATDKTRSWRKIREQV